MTRKSPSHIQYEFTARRIFTDREDPQAAFGDALHTPQPNNSHRILNFYGVGGQGKTALCEQFTKTLASEKEHNKQLGWAKLDFEVPAQRTIANALLAIRLQLAAQCKIPFPAFDTAFARHFAFSQPGKDIHHAHPDLFNQHNAILQDIETIAGDIADTIPGVGFFYKYGKKLSDITQSWWQRRGIAVLKDLDSMDQHKLLTALPMYLGADLYDWLFDEKTGQVIENRRLVILCDTYEALWRDQPTKTGLDALFIDEWLRNLVLETPGILLITLGRDKLNWAEIDTEWAADIKFLPLDGLSPADADKFLQQVPIDDEAVRAAIVESSEGLPFYLDLQVDQYESLKRNNSPLSANDFGGKHQEILPRFINHLDEHHRRSLQIIAHARFLNEALAQQLAQKFLGGKAHINLKQLTGFSFWIRQGNGWYLHALMREYLQHRQQQEEPALYAEIHQFLFDQYDGQLANLQQVTDITPQHKQALVEAGYHLLQLDNNKFPAWASNRGEIFKEAYAWEQLLPLWEMALEVAESLLHEAPLETALALNNLAVLYRLQGKYDHAEPLLVRSLTIREKTLGPDHPGVAVCLDNLAVLYQSQDKYDHAEPLHHRSLKIWETLGPDHPAVATSLNNLASLYRLQDKYDHAEPLYHRSLKIWEKTLGSDHPNIATSLNNLTALYYSQGKYDQAEPRCHRSLKIREETLGADHPAVATSLDNLAELYRLQGKYDQAEPLYHRSLKIREETLGADHTNVATSLNNLAELYRLQGKYDQAEPLCRRSLKICEETLGAEHPHVARSLNNLAMLYKSQGKYDQAEPLYQHAINIMQKAFPDGHPNLDTLLANYADLKRARKEALPLT